MGLDVERHVLAASMEDPECTLCGTCVDECPRSVISYTFSAGK